MMSSESQTRVFSNDLINRFFYLKTTSLPHRPLEKLSYSWFEGRVCSLGFGPTDFNYLIHFVRNGVVVNIFVLGRANLEVNPTNQEIHAPFELEVTVGIC